VTAPDPPARAGGRLRTGLAAVSASRLRALRASGVERRLVLIEFIDSVGSGLYLGGSAIFFTRAVGLSSGQIGFGVALGATLGLCTLFPVGLLADRVGPRRVFVGLCAWRAAGFAAYAVVRDFPSFLAVVCFLGLTDKAMGPIVQALVGATVGPAGRVQTMAYLRVVRNVGFTLSGVLVAIPLLLDTRSAYNAIVLADALSFVLAGWLVLRMPVRDAAQARALRREPPAAALRDRRFLALTALNGVLMLQLTMLILAIPLWLVHETRAPKAMMGPLIALNTLLVVLFQIPLSHRAATVPAAARQLAWSGVFFAVCCLLVAASATGAAVVLLTAAVLMLTVGELLQAAGGWRLSFDLAPEHRRGAYLSLFGLGTSAQAIVGPPLFTLVVFRAGAAGWAGLAALFALSGLLVPRLLRASDDGPRYSDG
jgi:MFS family permease